MSEANAPAIGRGLWILPTHQRPERCQATLDACQSTGMTLPGLVIINGDGKGYENLRLPPNWMKEVTGRDEKLNEVYRRIYAGNPDLDWYGFLADDLLPRTEGWDVKLVQKAGTERIVSANDLWQAPNRMHGAVVYGGNVLRKAGFWMPEGIIHMFGDDVWEHIGRQAGIWDVAMDVVTEHAHWMNGKAQKDQSYEKSHSLMERDGAAFKLWLEKDAPTVLDRLGVRSLQFDLKGRSLYIATPCHGGQMRAEYTMSLVATMRELAPRGIGVEVGFVPDESLVPRARNILVSQFLKSGCDTMLFVDADMGWKPDHVLRLLAWSQDWDKAVVGASGVRRSEPPSFCVNFLHKDDNSVEVCPKTGCVSLRHLGTGFIMIRREALERMIRVNPDLTYTETDRTGQITGQHHMLFNMHMADGHCYSEDYWFCDLWRKAGGKVWADPQIALEHIGHKSYTGALASILKPRAA
jgi:hypothetical protein